MAKSEFDTVEDEDPREAMNGIGAGLVSIDKAVREAPGYKGPPGSGIHRLLALAAAQLGITAGAFPVPVEPPAPADRDA